MPKPRDWAMPEGLTEAGQQKELRAREAARKAVEPAVMRDKFVPLAPGESGPAAKAGWSGRLTRNQEDAVLSWRSGDFTDLRDIASVRLLMDGEGRTMPADFHAKFASTLRHLDDALAKAPRHQGTVWRGMGGLSDKGLEAWAPGKLHTLQAPTSSAKNEKDALFFATAHGVPGRSNAIIIRVENSRSGADISEMNESEQEVLHPRGTKWRVVEQRRREDLDTKSSDTWEIICVEE